MNINYYRDFLEKNMQQYCNENFFTKSNVNTLRSNKNHTPLMLAILAGNYNQVKKLIKLGANVNAKKDIGLEFTMTPLLYATQRDNEDVDENEYIKIIKLLVKSGAIVNTKSSIGHNPLYKWIFLKEEGNPREDVVKYLISNGANINDEKLLTEAISKSSYIDSVLDLILRNGANYNTINTTDQNNLRNTPIFYKIFYNNNSINNKIKIIKQILNSKIKINQHPSYVINEKYLNIIDKLYDHKEYNAIIKLAKLFNDTMNIDKAKLKLNDTEKEINKALDTSIGSEKGLNKIVSDFAFGGKKKKKIRQHKGINQQTGRLKKGYKYSGKRLKSGLPQIVKVK